MSTERIVISRDALAGHIDEPVCTCAGCRPEWHIGVRCNCLVCKAIRSTGKGPSQSVDIRTEDR